MARRGRPKKIEKKPILSPHIIIGLALFLLCVFVFAGISVQQVFHQTTSTKFKEKTTLLSRTIPTPTIDLSQANIFRTYTNNLYGFTITYPALGENKDGKLVACGNTTQEHMRNRDGASIPSIQIDNFYQITVHPWGGQLSDYLGEKDKTILATLPFKWVGIPNVDEAVIFTSQNTTGYFKDVFALYKKGNLIYQIEKTQDYTPGCQMLFDPRDENQTFLAKDQSTEYQSLLFDQYKNWNETTSIQFPK